MDMLFEHIDRAYVVGGLTVIFFAGLWACQ